MAAGRYVLQGKLKALSPLLIGSGQNEATDSDVLLNAQGKPFIPATSLAGILRHATLPIQTTSPDLFKQFWGQENADGRGSLITLYDADCEGDFRLVVRDGIKIDNRTGLVADKKKYDYQVVEPGAIFSFEVRIQYQGEKESLFCHQMLAELKTLLESGQVNAGAKTNNGLGQLKLEQTRCYHFDFSQSRHVLAWMQRQPGQYSESCRMKSIPSGGSLPSQVLELEFMAEIASTFMVRGYPNGLGTQDLPDDMMLQSAGEPVLPGSSFKGALRNRAERILNTLGISVPVIIDPLFGWADDEQPTTKPRKGRLAVQETLLQHTTPLQQTRIKIDRFTGGTIESALFQTMPVFAIKNPEKPHICLHITVKNCQPYEAGLLMLLLKDLWTGDLALGGEKNVGRGRLIGREATLSWKGNLEKSIHFRQLADLTPQAQAMLNQWVQELVVQGSKTA